MCIFIFDAVVITLLGFLWMLLKKKKRKSFTGFYNSSVALLNLRKAVACENGEDGVFV